MDHNKLAERIEKRIDKLEDKLDPVLKTVAENKTNVEWLQGSVKLTITLGLTLVGIILTAMLNQ